MIRLAEIPWVEAAAWCASAKQPVVLVPVGATEAHGPHLPLGTDALLSEELARRVAETLEARGGTVLVAPTVAYAITEYAHGFCGTISLSPATATALVTDICASLIEQGFLRVCLVNSHLEPAHVASLRAAATAVEARTGRKLAFADQTERRWARTLTDEYKRGACHAGSYETSLMLAARPELVRDSRRALPPLPINLAEAMKHGVRSFEEAGAVDAYFGDPAGATVEEGESIYALLVTMVLTTIEETWSS